MKDPLQRTKVVIRQLPPSLSEDHLLPQIQHLFCGRYSWFSFRPGKTSQKRQKYSRAYIDFKRPEDAFEFAGFFNGHVFVNEKGSQFKVIVEYAPSQRIPKPSAKKDGREGTIYKDPEYLEFLKVIAKPPENLPIAEVKMEINEAEQSGSVFENPIVTPLMEFVRQKRAAENGSQGSLCARKLSRRVAASGRKLVSNATKFRPEKQKYILKGSSKKQRQKDKSSGNVVSGQDNQPASSSGREIAEHEKGITLTTNLGKKKVLLLRSREQEIPQLLDGNPSGSSPAPGAPRQSQRQEVGQKLIRGILLSNEAHQSQALKAYQPLKSETKTLDNVDEKGGTCLQSDEKFHSSNSEPSSLTSYNDSRKDDKHIRKDIQGFVSACEKRGKGLKNRGRPDHGVLSLRHSTITQATQEHPTSFNPAEMKNDTHLYPKKSMSSVENSLQRHFTHYQVVKNNGSSIVGEGKFSRRRVPSGSVVSQKQVWIQKSPGGS